MPRRKDDLAIATDQSIDGAHDLQAREPAVMRETSPLDQTMLDGDKVSAIPYPHAEERGTRPSKHGQEMHSPGLEPSFESRDFVPPQDEDVGVFLDGDDLTFSLIPHAEEQRSCPLKPSCESPGCAGPRDEENDVLPEGGGFSPSPTSHDGERAARAPP